MDALAPAFRRKAIPWRLGGTWILIQRASCDEMMGGIPTMKTFFKVENTAVLKACCIGRGEARM
jgi:hypothetical protein